jgi:tetratricopeptide (TPR) repeat protein
MPHYVAADIVHNASTDHRILAKPSKHDKPAGIMSLGIQAGDSLVPFPNPLVDPNDKEMSRDLGLALASVVRTANFGAEAISSLEIALQNDPDDVEVWEKKGLALLKESRHSEALAAFQTAIAKDPRRELSMNMAATTAQNLGEREAAATFFRRACDLNPWNPACRSGLAAVLVDQGAWEEAYRECQACLRLDPGNMAARKLYITCLLRKGRERDARIELGRLKSLHPAGGEQFESWFAAERGAARPK